MASRAEDQVRPGYGRFPDPAVASDALIKQKEKPASTEQAPSQSAASVRSRLQLLPGELRQKIFGYLLDCHRVWINRRYYSGEDNILRYRLGYHRLPFRDPKTQQLPESKDVDAASMPLNLILTCKSIRDETLFYFYANLQFAFHTLETFREFLDMISPKVKAVIRHIEIYHGGLQEHLCWFNHIRGARRVIAWKSPWAYVAEELPSLKIFHLNRFTYIKTESRVESRVTYAL